MVSAEPRTHNTRRCLDWMSAWSQVVSSSSAAYDVISVTYRRRVYSVNKRIHSHYYLRLHLHGGPPLGRDSIFIQILVVGSQRNMSFETEHVMALHGHPMSLILAPIDSAYATSYWSSILTLVLSCPVSEILQVFC